VRLIRFLFSLVFLAAVIWFAVTVKLGRRTLYGHLRAIFATQEAKDLAEGAKDEAKKIAEKLKHPDGVDAGAPLDKPTTKERDGLDKLIKDKTKK
jgi:hypothetical protein